MKKIAVVTSGGDVPGLNACIRAVVRTAIFNNLEVMGIQHGYEGMIKGTFKNLDALSVSNIVHLGGTILRSSRSKTFMTPEGRAIAYNNIRANNIEGIVLIGGDGSFQGAKKFSGEYDIPIIGIPKTIDNDITGTDVCIGYDTALNTAMEAIDRIRDTADSHQRIFVVELMGRESGYIAYGAGLAGGVEAIMVPETPADQVYLKKVLSEGWSRDKTSIIIAVAEGDESGGAFKIAEMIQPYFPDGNIRVCILGHIQRGGSPTAADRILAARLGVAAVQAMLDGRKDVMVGMVKGNIVFTPLEAVHRNFLDMNKNTMGLLEILAS